MNDDGINATIRRFGWPETLVADYDHWVVLLRPAAPTLGSLVLAAKGEATAFADLDPDAFAEQARVIADIERVLTAAVAYERINYLMLMMVDPHVHYHVVPRYEGGRTRGGSVYADAGWPGLPDMKTTASLDTSALADQTAWLRRLW